MLRAPTIRMRPAAAPGLSLILPTVLLLGVCAWYASFTGWLAVLNDTAFLLDRAKHLASDGNLDAVIRIYPPLFSVLVAPLMPGRDVTRTLDGIHWLNIALHVSLMVPVTRLCASYAGVGPRLAPWFALLVLLGPGTLSYTSHIMTESAFIAVLGWTLYFYERWSRTRHLSSAWVCGAGLAAASLLRHAGAVVPLSILGAEAISIAANRRCGDSAREVRGPLVMLGVWLVATLAWAVGERFFVHYEQQFVYGSLIPLAMNGRLVDVYYENLALSALYLLCGALHPGAAVALAQIAERPARLLRDEIALVTVLAGAGASVLWVMTMIPMEQGLGFMNRYLAPYLLPVSLVGLRALRTMRRRDATVATAILVLVFIAGAPANLSGGLADAVTPFMATTQSLGGRAVLKNLSFLVAMLSLLWLARSSRRVSQWGAAAGVGALALFCLEATGMSFKNSSWLQESNASQAAVLINAEARRGTPVFYDRDVNVHDTAINYVRLYVATPIPGCSRADIVQRIAALGKLEGLFVTTNRSAEDQLVAQENRGPTYVYRVQARMQR